MELAIIVDAYRFSKNYISYLNAKNIRCVHVQSTEKPIGKMQKSSTYIKTDYFMSLIFDGSVERLVKPLLSYQIKYVIAGSEPGVELTDKLANYFHVCGNGMSESLSRRDKYLMSETLRKKNIRAAKQLKSAHPDAILNWAKQHAVWPVVLKPLKSAATEDVYICDSYEKLNDYYEKIISKPNLFGEKNHQVLVQEFLKGTEYVVNTVSCEGKHFFSDIWKCEKRYIPRLDTVIYDRELLLPYQGEAQTLLIDYMKKVLDALEIQYGAAHAEIMLTTDGPVLIEVGARIGGHVDFDANKICLGHNQIELMLDSYVDPKEFFIKTQKTYRLKKFAAVILLSSAKEGIVSDTPLFKIIKSLSSFYSLDTNITVGSRVEKTKDLLTSIGKVILIHQNADRIELDYQRILENEENGLIVS